MTTGHDGANALEPIFDEEQIRAGFEIVGALQRETGTFLANRAKASSEAQKELEKEQAKPAGEQDREKVAQLTQVLQENATWAPGGAGRRVLTALTAAAGGNVTGGMGQFAQATGVTYLQTLGAEQVKALSPYLGGEGSAAHTALHAVLGCAGGAASEGDCGAGALGASAGVVLNTALDQLSRTEGLSASEKEARANLVASVVAGVAHAMGADTVQAVSAAQVETLYNRQLHDEDREQTKRLAAVTKEKGLSYTEADIANQQALMDLTVDGKTYYGDNQVATGGKPQDGTDWSYYGQDIKGESVWVQNVQRGDPDLQAFIVDNTNGKTANGMTYEATTVGSNPGLFRLPDFVNFQVDYFVGSAWGSFSRDGNSYFGYGVNKALPNSVNASASAQFGWLNRLSVSPGETNKFLAGYAGSGTVAFSAVGGGVVYSPGNGTATVLGVGGGANLSKAKNPASTGMGYTVDKGKTGMEW